MEYNRKSLEMRGGSREVGTGEAQARGMETGNGCDDLG
jgi:hypothetical protein